MTLRPFYTHKFGQVLVLLGMGTLLSNLPAHAQTLTAITAGWYNDSGDNNSGSGNYLAGYVPAGGVFPARIFHDYFTFDLSGVSGLNLMGAALDLYQPALDPNDPAHTGNGIPKPLTFNLGAVSTAPTLVDTTLSSLAIYNDLAGGAVYGSYALTPAGNGTTLHLSLGAAAISSITSHAGGLFTIGGYVPANDSYTFGFTSNGSVAGAVTTPTPTLTLTPAAVPEASTTASFGLLLALGLGGLVVAAKRKKMAV